MRLLTSHTLGLQLLFVWMCVCHFQVVAADLSAPMVLHALLGKWVDKKVQGSSQHTVTLDSDGQSCPVWTRWASGQTQWTKSLITLSTACCTDKTCIWLGQAYHLELPTSVPGEIRWARTPLETAFVWRRDFEQDAGHSRAH